MTIMVYSTMIFQISGYAGAGKDTLSNMLRTGQLTFTNSIFAIINMMYIVLAPHGTYTKCTQIALTTTDRERVAFADALKEEVHAKLEPMTDEEKIHRKEELRPLYIKRGLEAREEDPLYWVKRVEDKYQKSTARCVDITDHRFINEKIAGSITCRILRSAIKPAHPSECELDAVAADIVVIDGLFTWLYMMWYYPQYRSYLPIGILAKK